MSKNNLKMKFMERKGITLIALVVTIILLLILAGISISMLIGENGILNKAGEAKDVTGEQQIEEQIKLAANGALTRGLGKIRYNDLTTELDGQLGDEKYTIDPESDTATSWTVTANGKTYKIESTGFITIIKKLPSKTLEEAKSDIMIENTEVAFSDGVIVVPEGYKIATDSADKIAYGAVITDAETSGNEWVWVPVSDANVMYETASNPIELTGGGKITDTATLNDLKKIKVSKYSKFGIITGNTRGLPNDASSYREPDIVVGDDGASYDAVESNRTTAGFTKTANEITSTMTLAEMAETMNSEYETMIASVEKYHGFYIGRYELTANGEKPGEPLSSDWYSMYAACKTLSVNEKVMTRMVWGNQWDIACNFIANYGDKKDINASKSWGNYYNTSVKASDETTELKAIGTGKKLDTGITTYTKANNIYDIAGNTWEWTQEIDIINVRAVRGGDYMRWQFLFVF